LYSLESKIVPFVFIGTNAEWAKKEKSVFLPEMRDCIFSILAGSVGKKDR
jgi:hypothetical protein